MKKVLSLTLAVVMAAAAIPMSAMAKTYYLGDVDGNGKVNSSDALAVLEYSVGKKSSIDTNVADITKDSKVNSADALQILKTSIGMVKPVQVTVDDPSNHVAKPIGRVTRTWSLNKTNFSAKIERLTYGAELTLTINANNKNDYNSQIVNYKTFSYWPMANVAVITPKNGTLLRFSKGSTASDPETLAKNAGAEIAVDGTFYTSDVYETKTAATIRDGAIYKSYTGEAGKAKPRMVVYKNGDWNVVNNFDNATAKAEIAKGAWLSIRYQDVTVTNGQKTNTFKRISSVTGKEVNRNQTFIGHTYDGKIVFLTSEMMPISSAADILVAYNCKDAVQINGGNSTYMYVKGIGNTTGSTGASIKNLNKIGYLETEWYAKNGLLAAGKGGGLSYTDLDVAYFK